EEIRVTDRRRIKIDSLDNDAAAAEDDDAPARPTQSQVDELEARARGAEQKLLEVQSRFDQLRTQLQRETNEIRQRLNRSADERALNNKAELVKSLLPVMDNLQRAMEAARQSNSLELLLNGLQGTVSGFEGVLAAYGAETVSAVGASFDPELHEAVDAVEVEHERDGLVTQQYSKGYRINDRLLRPARVQVGRSLSAAGAPE
ncbi:MAG: nucleotide exchange factor GrpE, partial [Pyrinomonadaceae bacterium]